MRNTFHRHLIKRDIGFIVLIVNTPLDSVRCQISLLPASASGKGRPAVEVMPTQNDAQKLLEFYLLRMSPGSGMGKTKGVRLDDVLALLRAFDLIMPGPLMILIEQLLLGVGVKAKTTRYRSPKGWRHVRLKQSNLWLLSLKNDCQWASVRKLALHLRQNMSH